MSNEKMHIESNTVQETLVIPLWGRKYCSEIYPEIYQDQTAKKIMEKLDYDFSTLEAKKNNTMFRFGYLEAAALCAAVFHYPEFFTVKTKKWTSIIG